MKKIVFISILLLSSLCGKSQQLIEGKGVKFILPVGAVHLTDQHKAMWTVYKYKISDMLLSYRDSSVKYSPNSLETYKKTRDDFNTKGESGLAPDHYTSYIKKYSHCWVAVNRIGNESSGGTYFFYAVNKTETWGFSGYFNYSNGGLAKADAILTDLLNSLEFTK